MTGLPGQAPAAGDITNVFFYKYSHNRERYSVGAARARRAEEGRDAQQHESAADIERMLGLSPLAEVAGEDEDEDEALDGDLPSACPDVALLLTSYGSLRYRQVESVSEN